MFLYPLFDFIAKNRWLQIVLMVLATIITLGFYLAWRDGNVRKQDRVKSELKTVEVIDKIEKEARADADHAIEARDTAPHYDSADSVPDDVAGRIFKD